MDVQEIERKFTPHVKDFVCYNTHLRIVNQIIYKEFIFAKWENRDDWAERASVRLEHDHGISRTPGTLKSLLGQIRNGTRDGVAASDFTQGITYESAPSSRYEKDAMHAKMETLICEYLDGYKLHYVGLPANQIVSVSRLYDTVVACEKDPRMAQFMFDMNKYISKSPHVNIYSGNIFNFLENTDRKFNVFEFDMMCALDSRMIRRIANAVLRTAISPALLVVVSIGGRHITTHEYECLMPGVLIGEIEKSVEWSVTNNAFKAGGRYKDIKIPMRYELLVIQKNDNEIEYNPEDNDKETFMTDAPKIKHSVEIKTPEGRIIKLLQKYCNEFVDIKRTRTSFIGLTKEQMSFIQSCLGVGADRLTAHQKKILDFYLEGNTQVQIGKKIGISQTSVHKALHGNIDYSYGKRYGGIFKKVIDGGRREL